MSERIIHAAKKILQGANDIKSQFSDFAVTDAVTFRICNDSCKELKKFEDFAFKEAEKAFLNDSDEKAVKNYKKAGEIARKLRLDTEKLSKNFEKNFNVNSILFARNQLAVYQASFPHVTHWQPYHEDFEGVVKGMRSTSFDKKQAKWKSELARLKLEITQQAANYATNTAALVQFEEYREGWGYDYQTNLTKPPAEFLAEMNNRVETFIAINAELTRRSDSEKQHAFLCDIAAVVQKHTGLNEAISKRHVNSIIEHLLIILE